MRALGPFYIYPTTYQQRIQQLLTYWMCSMCLVLGYCLGPTYKVSKSCERTEECDPATGEMCWQQYDGCSKGKCMCDPTRQTMNNGVCKILHPGGTSCTPKDLCPSGMSCQQGTCQCISGRMTSDGLFCLKDNHRLLGERCDVTADRCWQKASYGYTLNEVKCSYRGRCECTEGLKKVGISCHKWKIEESGCTEAFHCMGGALCLRGSCLCPNAYYPVAGNTKCAKRGATCDEIDGRKYCGKSLVCNQCDGDNTYKCVKYLIPNDNTFMSSSQSVRPSVLLVLCIVVSIQTWSTVYR